MLTKAKLFKNKQQWIRCKKNTTAQWRDVKNDLTDQKETSLGIYICVVLKAKAVAVVIVTVFRYFFARTDKKSVSSKIRDILY